MRRILYLSMLSLILFACSNEKNHPKKIQVSAADSLVVLPPQWAFGVAYGAYTNQQQTIETIKDIMGHDYPIDAYWIDSWFWDWQNKGKGPKKYLDFVADTISYPNRKDMWNFMQENHIKGGFWVWDCILETGNEDVYNEFDSLGYFSSKYLNKNPWHNAGTTTAMFSEDKKHPGTWCGNIDFDNPEAVAYFKHKMKPFFDEGADFLKLDRTSAIPVVKAVFEMSQEFGKESKGRGYTLSHTGGTDSDEFKKYPTKWTDDTRSDWTIENPTIEFNTWVPKVALKENIAMYTNPESETSKIPFLTNDTGGFDMGKTDIPSSELFIRWTQFSTFTPIMEVFSQPENPTRNLAFNYTPQADSLFKKYTHLRMELFPYIYTHAIKARIEGKPIIQNVEGHLYDYHFGSEFLVSPVFEKGSTSRNISFPNGNWVDFWTGKTIKGNNKLSVDAPLDKIPLYVKEGGLIPMRPYSPHVATATRDTIVLHVFPGKDNVFKLYEDDGMSNDYLDGIFSMTELQLSQTSFSEFKLNIKPVQGFYKGMPEKRVWKIIVHSQRPYTSYLINSETLKLNEEGLTQETDYFSVENNQNINIEFKI